MYNHFHYLMDRKNYILTTILDVLYLLDNSIMVHIYGQTHNVIDLREL